MRSVHRTASHKVIRVTSCAENERDEREKDRKGGTETTDHKREIEWVRELDRQRKGEERNGFRKKRTLEQRTENGERRRDQRERNREREQERREERDKEGKRKREQERSDVRVKGKGGKRKRKRKEEEKERQREREIGCERSG